MLCIVCLGTVFVGMPIETERSLVRFDLWKQVLKNMVGKVTPSIVSSQNDPQLQTIL